MLIDASHPEETRVLIVDGNRLEDFDVEVESRSQLKGNIYLAKVTRVEPSLQAAFVDYGGNRHGFLAFSEIHPDYYQIPVADREALLAQERADAPAEEAVESAEDGDESHDASGVETLGGDDTEEVEVRRRSVPRRHYKIQEVIKRRQIILVQVVKEERGTKGAALTTYMSLAGRYCVLMPNTDRGGGISRKIGQASDRRKLKTIVNDLGIPGGMAVIVRTAGAERTKTEISRDYDYLIRLWSQVRDRTLESIAPCLVHQEGDLIKRAIRDLYTKDIEEVIVDGDTGYRAAKDFMKLLMPSHAKKVQRYEGNGVPITNKYHIQNQLDAIHSPDVHLKAGGYIVINPTEALVSIDVNSGRATKERNIEETALRTNLEAADEIARQLRLRDLAGLIVIDFIDMEVHRNQTRVERQLKEAMGVDRARIQIGRISPFGLLELSRQRLRPSLLETSSEPCPHCEGTGVRRSTDTTALQMLRVIEEAGMNKKSDSITVYVPTGVALYLLNHKRASISEIEARYQFSVFLANDDSLIPPDHRIETGAGETVVAQVDRKAKPIAAEAADAGDAGNTGNTGDAGEDAGKKRRRRRSRGRKREDGEAPIEASASDSGEGVTAKVDDASTTGANADASTSTSTDEEQNPKRRRGRRGGRRRRRHQEATGETTPQANETGTETGTETTTPAIGGLIEGPAKPELLAPPQDDSAPIPLPDDSAATDDAEKPKPRRRGRRPKAEAAPETAEAVEAAEAQPAETGETPKPAPKPRARRKPKAALTEETATDVSAEEPVKPKRRSRAKATKDADPAVPKVVNEIKISAVATRVAEKAPEPESEAAPAPAPVPTAEPAEVVEAAAPETAAAAAPKKGGWWRRG